jgi:acyl-CoA thioesterase I
MQTLSNRLDSSNRIRTRRVMLPVFLTLGALLPQALVSHTARAADKVTRLACAGDSITAGTYGNVYPVILQQLLGPDFEVKNFGVEATTLLASGAKPYMMQPEFGQLIAARPDIVVLMLGTNDSKPEDWIKSAAFLKDYALLIARIRRANPKVRIFVCTPPTVVSDRWGIRGKVIGEAVYPKVIAAAKQDNLIDIHAKFKAGADLHSDGIHPNQAGATLIAEAVKTVVLK